MIKLRISHGSGKKALRLHGWCSGRVNGQACGSRSLNDSSVRVFCSPRCASTFVRHLAQTEPSAMTAPA